MLVPFFVILALLAVSAPAALLLVLRWQESRHPRVICLMYHRLAPRDVCGQRQGTERVFSLPVEEFERQLEYLQQNHYSFVTPDQVREFVNGGGTLPERSVLLTFDDGCRSFGAYAVPLLRRYGACAVLYVTTDPDSRVFKISGGADPRLTDVELAALDPVVAYIGSHAVTHRPLRGLSDAEVRHELLESRHKLERITGRPIVHFSIPGNWFNSRVVALAREAGYQAVWCSWVGAVRPGADCFRLRRVNVEGQLSLAEFARLLTPMGIAQRRLISMVKSAPGRLLGPSIWLPLRRAILKLLPGGYISFARWRRWGAVVAASLAVLAAAIGWLAHR